MRKWCKFVLKIGKIGKKKNFQGTKCPGDLMPWGPNAPGTKCPRDQMPRGPNAPGPKWPGDQMTQGPKCAGGLSESEPIKSKESLSFIGNWYTFVFAT